MSFDSWTVFCATFFVLALNPGPAVLLVVSHGIAADLRAALLAAAGIAATNAVYFLLTALGLSAVLLASATLFEVIRWVGVVYLVYAGVQMIRSAQRPDVRADSKPARPERAFVQGMALQAGNPLTVAFFTALLPQFIDPAADAQVQFVVLGATTVALELVALSAYAVISFRGGRLLTSERAVRVQRRVSGGVLLASAVGLALVRRR